MGWKGPLSHEALVVAQPVGMQNCHSALGVEDHPLCDRGVERRLQHRRNCKKSTSTSSCLIGILAALQVGQHHERCEQTAVNQEKQTTT
jgi:hypothetical protein